jgi:hypothetical protein
VTSSCRLSEQCQEATRPVRGGGRVYVDGCGLRTGTLRTECDDHRTHDRPDHDALGWAGLVFVSHCLMPDRAIARLQRAIALRSTGIRNGSPRLFQVGAVAMA